MLLEDGDPFNPYGECASIGMPMSCGEADREAELDAADQNKGEIEFSLPVNKKKKDIIDPYTNGKGIPDAGTGTSVPSNSGSGTGMSGPSDPGTDGGETPWGRRKYRDTGQRDTVYAGFLDT